jgi:hypothetical protein
LSKVYVIGTCDTKEAELRYAVERVRAAGGDAVLVDISTTPSTASVDVTPEMVARHHAKGGCGAGPCRPGPRGDGDGRGAGGVSAVAHPISARCWGWAAAAIHRS